MNKIGIRSAGLITILCNVTCFAHLYSGDPAISKLSPSLTQSQIMVQAPKTRVRALTYRSQDEKGSYYSTYQIHPTTQTGNKILYWTHENIAQTYRFPGLKPNDTAIVNGKGVSFGGIFWPLEKMTVTNSNGKIIYYNKIDIQSIQPLSGHLFPLQVGNDLKFHFTRQHIQKIGGIRKRIKDTGILEYKVVKRFKNYPYSDKKVPGFIYRIQVLESTNIHPKWYLTDIYDYAPKLGWYISDIYFNQNNEKIASYHMHHYN